MEITKTFRFEIAHTLPGYLGNCARLHGHSVLLEVTVEGKPVEDYTSPYYGMVLDFAELSGIVKAHIVDVWDHHYLSAGLREPQAKALVAHGLTGDIVNLPVERTTAENLAKYVFEYLSELLGEDGRVKIKSITYWETTTGKATYRG